MRAPNLDRNTDEGIAEFLRTQSKEWKPQTETETEDLEWVITPRDEQGNEVLPPQEISAELHPPEEVAETSLPAFQQIHYPQSPSQKKPQQLIPLQDIQPHVKKEITWRDKIWPCITECLGLKRD